MLMQTAETCRVSRAWMNGTEDDPPYSVYAQPPVLRRVIAVPDIVVPHERRSATIFGSRRRARKSYARTRYWVRSLAVVCSIRYR